MQRLEEEQTFLQLSDLDTPITDDNETPQPQSFPQTYDNTQNNLGMSPAEPPTGTPQQQVDVATTTTELPPIPPQQENIPMQGQIGSAPINPGVYIFAEYAIPCTFFFCRTCYVTHFPHTQTQLAQQAPPGANPVVLTFDCFTKCACCGLILLRSN